MEEFYNNPFRRDQSVDDVCYASVQSFSTVNSPKAVENFKETDLASVSTALRFQTQLSEALRANASLRGTYEAHIEAQRKEMDRLGEENSELQKQLTRLESQVRSITLEYDCLAMAHKREVEKNALLEDKVHGLEEELSSLERRALELSAAYGSRTARQMDGYSSPVSQLRSPGIQRSPHKSTAPSSSSHNHSNHNNHEQQLAEMRLSESTPFLQKTSNAVVRRNNNNYPRDPPELWTPDEATAAAAKTTRRPNTGNDMTHVVEKNSLKSYGKVPTYPMQNAGYAQEAMVKELEKQLLRESQVRDNLEKQLQRIESSRIRSGSERAKKITLERELIAAQQAVRDTRKKLRSLTALKR